MSKIVYFEYQGTVINSLPAGASLLDTIIYNGFDTGIEKYYPLGGTSSNDPGFEAVEETITQMTFARPAIYGTPQDIQSISTDYGTQTFPIWDARSVPDNFVIPSLPDLTVKLNIVTPTISPTGNITINFTITNSGTESASTTKVGIYVSDDATIDTNDLLIGYVDPGAIAGNTSRTTNVTVPVSSLQPIPGGKHFIGIIADYDNQVAESNENNNASNALQITSLAPSLFTTDNDNVNFGALSASEVAAINAFSPPYDELYDALGGNDTITLPNKDNDDNYLLVPAPGAPTVSATWDPTRTFVIGASTDTAATKDNVSGGNGDYNIAVHGAATVNITIVGDGSSDISLGLGSDTVTISGNGDNTISGGTGTDKLNLNGSGNNIFYFAGLGGTLVQGTIVDNGSLTLNTTNSGRFTGVLSGSGSLITEGGAITIGGNAVGFTGNTTIASGKLELQNPISFGYSGAIAFTAAGNETLQIDGNAMPMNLINGFAEGDTIDLRGVPFTSNGGAFLDVTKSSSTPQLDVYDNHQIYTVQIGDPASSFANQAFVLSSDRNGGTNIKLAPGLSFDNTFDANTVESVYQFPILMAEADLASRWLNPITINLSFDVTAQSIDLASDQPTYAGAYDYGRIVGALQALANAEPDNAYLQSAVKSLPLADPSGGKGFTLPLAYARMLGLATQVGQPDDTISFREGVVTDGEEAAIEDLIPEGGMGRFGGLGGIGSGPWTGPSAGVWSIMDLFRFNLLGKPDYSNGRDGQPTFFSYNGGLTTSFVVPLTFTNQFNLDGTTLGNNSNPSDFNGHDNFELDGRAQTDIEIMDAIGWNPNPSNPNSQVVESGRTLSVLFGQTVIGIAALTGGLVKVLGSVKDTLVEGTLDILPGGVADPTEIYSGGLEVISRGGRDLGAFILGGEQHVFGYASGATIISGLQEVEAGGTAKSTVAIGGSEIISAHGTDIGARISGGTQFDYGNTAVTRSFPAHK